MFVRKTFKNLILIPFSAYLNKRSKDDAAYESNC